MDEEDAEFVEEFLSAADPSILHFLLASGEQACPAPARACVQWSRWQPWAVRRGLSMFRSLVCPVAIG